jgi:hypothetical protein
MALLMAVSSLFINYGMICSPTGWRPSQTQPHTMLWSNKNMFFVAVSADQAVSTWPLY